MDQVLEIIKNVKEGKIAPLYLLMGEEPYYIDKLADFFEQNILQEHERDFNQTILYGRDVTVEDIIGSAKRYPMMADRQLVVVKEAQELIRTIEKLESYTENPQPTTVLVICYKYKTIDKRKKLIKNVINNGVVFESKKLYENQIGTWLTRVLQGRKLAIEPKAAAMLVDFLGTDLSRIANEIDKLAIILKPGTTITPAIIEENIGFSKDFNPFELRKAISEKNQLKAYQIVDYFSKNAKENPLVVVNGIVFSFFSQLLQYHGLKDRTPANVAKTLIVNPYFVKDYEKAFRNYPMKKVSAIVAALRDIDVKSKGIGANNLDDYELYKEMLVKIFN